MRPAGHFALGRGTLLAVLAAGTVACASLQPGPSRSGPPTPQPTLPPAARPSPAPPPPPPGALPLPPPSPPAALPPASQSSTAPSRPQSDASSASNALLAQSRAQRASGNVAQATASIERALRLDPNNAELWVERGELALQTGDAAQAGTMARKALSLAGANGAISARAQRLLQAAGAH
ncbi:MAG TPA: hypothetical protein VHH11_06945 [Gammaproteobacteria bacterium]|jgi:hypothetical protein|nr:hypothetical protein [Gammaproteobacteria bacterium]